MNLLFCFFFVSSVILLCRPGRNCRYRSSCIYSSGTSSKHLFFFFFFCNLSSSLSSFESAFSFAFCSHSFSSLLFSPTCRSCCAVDLLHSDVDCAAGGGRLSRLHAFLPEPKRRRNAIASQKLMEKKKKEKTTCCVENC